MKTKLLALLLLGGSTLFAGVNFNIGIGVNTGPRGGYYVAPPPPPPLRQYIPRSPGRGYVWVPGYWISVGNRYNWRAGYWAAPVRYNNGRGNAYGKRNRNR